MVLTSYGPQPQPGHVALPGERVASDGILHVVGLLAEGEVGGKGERGRRLTPGRLQASAR
jgi:hypothetical protein